MKYLIPVLCAVALLGGCAGKKDPEVEVPKSVVEAPKGVVDADQLQFRDGLRYFEEKPFTGVAVIKYPNGQNRDECTYKDGKRDGLWTRWNGKGEKWIECTYKDGKRDGLWNQWHYNGLKSYEATYKAGEEISAKHWDEDGNRTK